jgi:chromosome partitioning protein
VRTIAIINQKGGCGKTTCSINLAAVLALRGHRTLLVDMDPQSHCALGLAVPDAQIERSTADLLRHGLDGSIALPDITWQISRCLDLAPSSMALAGIETQLASASDKDRRLAQVLSTVADRYDFCIIDCPPSIGLLTFNALRAADEVIIPVETGFFSMQGSVKQEQTIRMLARRVGHDVRFKVLPTMYDVRTKLAREILSELKKHFEDRLLPLVINFNSKLKEAASFGQPITEYDAASRGMQDFEQLVQWLLANPPRRAEPVAVGAGVSDEADEVGEGATASSPAAPSRSSNPALSRAAELVERARALSTRTAQLSAELAADPTALAEGAAPAPLPPQPEPTEPPPHRDAALEQKLARLYGVRPTAKGVLFVQPAREAQQVAVAGDFNDWNPSRTPLRRDENLGVWQACVPIPPGRYRYRLVIDGRWIQDPHNATVESNPFGELNNILEIK